MNTCTQHTTETTSTGKRKGNGALFEDFLLTPVRFGVVSTSSRWLSGCVDIIVKQTPFSIRTNDCSSEASRKHTSFPHQIQPTSQPLARYTPSAPNPDTRHLALRISSEQKVAIGPHTSRSAVSKPMVPHVQNPWVRFRPLPISVRRHPSSQSRGSKDAALFDVAR